MTQIIGIGSRGLSWEFEQQKRDALRSRHAELVKMNLHIARMVVSNPSITWAGKWQNRYFSVPRERARKIIFGVTRIFNERKATPRLFVEIMKLARTIAVQRRFSRIGRITLPIEHWRTWEAIVDGNETEWPGSKSIVRRGR